MEGDPKPEQIVYYPSAGELKYLFRKKVTANYSSLGLFLVGKSSEYFETLTQSLQNKIHEGLKIAVYTPDFGAMDYKEHISIKKLLEIERSWLERCCQGNGNRLW